MNTHTKLTQEQKRIKIAEACGWKKVGRSLAGLGGYPHAGYEKHPLPSPEDHPENWRIRDGKAAGNQWFPIPDYYNDLNAMHEAEKSVPYELQPFLIRNLKKDVMNYEKGVSDWDIYTATAAQRAEAFGKTLGLW